MQHRLTASVLGVRSPVVTIAMVTPVPSVATQASQTVVLHKHSTVQVDVAERVTASVRVVGKLTSTEPLVVEVRPFTLATRNV